MTNPAEKIRQVVERHMKILHDCTVSGDIVADKQVVLAQVARNSHRVVSVAILSAIIEEMEKDVVFYTEHAEGKYDLGMQDPTVYAERRGARNYAKGRLEWLKEARTSITNSTHE